MAQRSQAHVAFGRAVRDLRQRDGLSQEELGFRSGLHRTYVGGVERGERNLTLRSVERLAAKVGVPVLDLLR